MLLSQKETKQDAHIGGRLLWSMITISHFLIITMMITGVTDPGEASPCQALELIMIMRSTHGIMRYTLVANYNNSDQEEHSYHNIFLVAGKILASYSYSPVSN